MEPITFLAIAAFLAYQSSATVVDRATADVYEQLKGKLKSKFGDRGEVADAVSRLEDKPESEGRKGVVGEELEQAGADQDPEIEEVAKELLGLLGDQPGGVQQVQSLRGNYNAQAQDNSSASVSIHQPEKRETE